MNIREPPKPAAILATPINVEESRAQRLQRQQSRFRDRGGIFVPSSRNTLADILLGKAPPLKKAPSRRSVSASPLKRKSLGAKHSAEPPNLTEINVTTRSSPRKQSGKSTHGGKSDRHVTGMGIKTHTKGKGKVPTEETDKPILVSVEEKARPRPKEIKKKPASTKQRKSRSNSQQSNGTASKPKSRGKTDVTTLAPILTVAGAQNVLSKPSKPKVHVNSIPSTSRAPPVPSIPQVSEAHPRNRRKSHLYSSGGSEDEYIPKEKRVIKAPKGEAKKPSTSKTSKLTVSQDNDRIKNITTLPDIPEEDEDTLSDHISAKLQPNLISAAQIPRSNTRTAPISARRVSQNPDHKLKASRATISAKNSKQTKSTEEESDLESKKPKTVPQSIVNKKKPSRIPVYDEESTMDKQLALVENTRKKGIIKAANKRVANDVELESEEERPPPKRAKSSKKSKDTENEELKGKSTSRTSRKRPRIPDSEEGGPEKVIERKPKKKKTDGDRVERMKKDKVANERQKLTKVTKSKKTSATSKPMPKRKNVKEYQRSVNGSYRTQLKENNLTKPQLQAVVRRGPPKSVLERLHSSTLDVQDNSPDEIDFLS